MGEIKEFSFKKLLTETTELGRDLKLVRNGCYMLIIFLSICFFMYILSADMYEDIFFQPATADEPNWMPFIASIMSGKSELWLIKNGEFNRVAFISGIFFNFVALGVFSYITHFLAKIFSSITDSISPFTEINVRYLKTASTALSALGGAYIILGNSLFTFVVVELSASFLYALSMIFQYGSQLQLLSDETI